MPAADLAFGKAKGEQRTRDHKPDHAVKEIEFITPTTPVAAPPAGADASDTASGARASGRWRRGAQRFLRAEQRQQRNEQAQQQEGNAQREEQPAMHEAKADNNRDARRSVTALESAQRRRDLSEDALPLQHVITAELYMPRDFAAGLLVHVAQEPALLDVLQARCALFAIEHVRVFG